MIIEKHFFDANNVELDFGDILQSNSIYPFFDSNTNNYYGIIIWNDRDSAIEIRTTVGNNDIVVGSSDGNSDFISEYCDNNGILKDFIKIGSVKNPDDVKKYLRDKDWSMKDCV